MKMIFLFEMRKIVLKFAFLFVSILKKFAFSGSMFEASEKSFQREKSFQGTDERKLKLRLRRKVRDFAFCVVFKSK